MVLVFAATTTPRLRYILHFIGAEIFDTPVTITNDKEEFVSSAFVRINYSDVNFNFPVFTIRPVGLLFESGINAAQPDVIMFEKTKALYKTEGDFPFDLFAAAFYLISRLEEYQPHTKDEYGRYAHTNSLAFREGFLSVPVINIWLAALKEALANRYPSLLFKRQQFVCNITYDIDIAYSYLHKGPLRTAAGFLRSIFAGNWQQVAERWQVLGGRKQDPFDCYEWLDALHLYCRLKPCYFFLVAKKQTGYDKNISTAKRPFRELIEYYAGRYETGLHPSWQSGDHPKLLKEEKEWLEVVADKPIRLSRQHYIRFDTPQTFRRLAEIGITDDYSMGYGTVNGFRASVCSPFKWYDLLKEAESSLTIHPFCFMDANSLFEQKQTPQEAYLELTGYYETAKRLNGTITTIWHNHLLGHDEPSLGWRQMFELFMKETVYWDAYSDATN